jgi:hypothetical protein
MKYLFFILLISINASAQDCSIARVTSGGMKGNAFAVTANRMIVNDHTLAEAKQFVDVDFGGDKTKARILFRDFHTDLALIEVPAQLLKPCKLGSTDELYRRQTVEIEGFDVGNRTTTKIYVQLINKASTKMQVPGIRSALEMVSQREKFNSMSGGVVRSGNSIYGMVTQAQEGIILSITAEDIGKFIEQVNSGTLPARQYQFNRATETFQFNGLEMSGKEQIKKILAPRLNGNPHEGKGGNPHEGLGVRMKTSSLFSPQDKNEFVSLRDLELGYAVAKVKDFPEVLKTQPLVGEVIKKTKASVIYIKSVDGQEIKSLFDLIRALGECRRCLIDNFYVETNNADEISNHYLKAVVKLSQLLDSFSESKRPEFVLQVMPDIDEVNKSLNKLALETLQIDGVSQRAFNTTLENWQKVEEKILRVYLNDRENDLLLDLRGLILEQPRFVR